MLCDFTPGPHSSTPAWKVPWTGEPGGLQSMGSLRVGHDWATSLSLSLSCIGEGNGNPLQCSCLESPRDGGAWWAAVYGVAQSRTRLKRLSNSSSSSSNPLIDFLSHCVSCGRCSLSSVFRFLSCLSGCWRRLMGGPWTARRLNQSIPRNWSWSSNTLATWCEEFFIQDELIGKDPAAGKDWRQEEKGMTEDEMVGWHHQCDGHEFEQTPGDSEGQGSLVCCSSGGFKELDTTLDVILKSPCSIERKIDVKGVSILKPTVP